MPASIATSSTTVSTALPAVPAASHPCKQVVRAYLARRCKDTCPPPPPDEIRRELGWEMLVDHAASPPVTHG